MFLCIFRVSYVCLLNENYSKFQEYHWKYLFEAKDGIIIR